MFEFASNHLNRFFLNSYRFLGFLVLAASLIGLLGYGAVMLYFMYNSTWIAPTVLSPTSDKVLQFNSGYLSALQVSAQLEIALDQQKLALATSTNEYSTLITYREKISHGEKLEAMKKADLAVSQTLLTSLGNIKAQTNQSLKLGLVTQDDAVRTITSIQQFGNTLTDSHIGLATLQQQLIGLDYQIAQLADAMKLEQHTVNLTSTDLEVANKTINNLRSTSYAHAVLDSSNLAFVSYDNLPNVKVGDKVYDCKLMLVWCHEIGTIKHVYSDEQLVDFPLFNVKLSRTVRGVFAELNVTDPKGMRSLIVFAGSKPFYF